MRITALMIGLVITLLITTGASHADAETSAAKAYRALVKEYDEEGGARLFAKRFIKLAEQHPRDPVATDALLWVVKNVRGRPDTTRALRLLASDHVESSKLAPMFKDIAGSRSLAAEGLLRAVLAKSSDKHNRGQAAYYLAALLDLEASLVQQLQAQPELAPSVRRYYGKEYGEHLLSRDLSELAKQRELVYERIQKSFSDVELQDTTLGTIADKMLFQIRHLSVGRVAPDIVGEDILGKDLKLSHFRGNVVMLAFWGHW